MGESSPEGVPQLSELRTRRMRIVAQDAGVRHGSSILTADVDLPYEELAGGPLGHRIHVVDYDATTGTLYRPAGPIEVSDESPTPDGTIMGDPAPRLDRAPP